MKEEDQLQGPSSQFLTKAKSKLKVDIEGSNHIFCKVSNMQDIGHLEVNRYDLGYQFDCYYTCTCFELYRINFSCYFFLSFLDTFHTLLEQHG